MAATGKWLAAVNPQAVAVRAFKQPSAEELNHDFLWRCQRALPGRGEIGIFNRSHYEEVLVVRVHPDLLAAERLPAQARKHDVWARRYREINDWERYLAGNGIHGPAQPSHPASGICRMPASSNALRRPARHAGADGLDPADGGAGRRRRESLWQEQTAAMPARRWR